MANASVGRSIVAVIVSSAGVASAQTCTPEWQGQPGTPGIQDGYVAPIVEWNDGTGPALFVGGSFSKIGNVTGTGLLAKFNPSTNVFSKLGPGLSTGSTNGFLTSIQPYNPGTGQILVVGGFFASAGGQAGTKSLAKWDGTAWGNIGTNFVANSAASVWSMTVWNGRLYVGGSFPDIGTVVGANGVASWDGTAWQGLGSGIGSGFSPNAFSMKVFDDGSGEALYVGGRFNEIGGVPGTALIGRWNGSTWTKVGAGVFAGTFSDIEAMEIFNDGSGNALFCGGWDIGVAGSGNASVAKWNGTTWTKVAQYLGGRTTSLKAWDDGSGPGLYAGGTAQPGINYLAKLVSNNWDIYDGGVGGGIGGNFPSVFGLGTFGDDLYVGGNFSTAGASGIAANGLVRHTGCPASCYADCDANGALNIDDFICFQTLFALSDPAADCDSGGTLNIDDFICFQTFFALGC
jgi:trimeric autotransporter adhesin